MRQALCVLAIFTGTVSAGEIPLTPLVTLDPREAVQPGGPPAGILPPSNESWGWAFRGMEAAQVTHLGWYDSGGDGLSHAHKVGIWRDTLGAFWPHLSLDELVVQAEIPAGTAARLFGPWRIVPIEPFWITPGDRLHIVGQNHADSMDDLVLWGAFLGFAPDRTHNHPSIELEGMSAGQSDFGSIKLGGWLPEGRNGRSTPGAYMGPMVFIGSLIIPEPATWMSGLTVALGTWLMSRGRHSECLGSG